ncbi:hypothetical protein L9F63_023170, partial [Diploptera punctata]
VQERFQARFQKAAPIPTNIRLLLNKFLIPFEQAVSSMSDDQDDPPPLKQLCNNCVEDGRLDPSECRKLPTRWQRKVGETEDEHSEAYT